MDFSKAFDKVSHSKLITKLHSYGVGGKTNKWIQAFLSGRTQSVLVEGESPSSVSVDSGVPQGSVLGPCLFLYYINDIPEGLQSAVRLFADNTIVYKHSQWEKEWQMEFHPQKCQVIPITRNRNIILNKYTLNGHTLEVTKEAKYLGVTLTSDLKWNKHIDNITSKANKTLGFIKRNIRISSPKIKTQAYNSLVRPLLEYASPVWDPHTKQNIDQIEKVQRRAARYVSNCYHRTSSVTTLLQTLGWRTLATRRQEARLILFYKIVHGFVNISPPDYLLPFTRPSRLHHMHAFQIPHSSSDYHLYSFFPWTIRTWNSLPAEIVSQPSLDFFKEQIPKQLLHD